MSVQPHLTSRIVIVVTTVVIGKVRRKKFIKRREYLFCMGVPDRGAWKFRVPSLASAFGGSHQKPDRIKIYVVAA